MKQFLYLFGIIALLGLQACGPTKSVTPLSQDRYRIDISAPPSFTRAEAQSYANKKAAETTLSLGYDRFKVLSGRAWTETEVYQETFHDFPADPFYNNTYGYDPFYDRRYSTSLRTVRNPETTMVIKLYKNGQKGAEKAVDAALYLQKLENNSK